MSDFRCQIGEGRGNRSLHLPSEICHLKFPDQLFVDESTSSSALFGAIGALAATELVRRRRQRLGWNRAWLPLAGGMGLLAMLGTGAGSDLTAHGMGLLAGAALGLLSARAISERPPAAAQAALAFCAIGAIALAWLAALA